MLRALSHISRQHLLRYASTNGPANGPANGPTNGPKSNPKVAIILSGCGFCDGTEIHEATAAMVHLSRLNYEPVCYAPDKPQTNVINHSTGAEMEEKRNILAESARLSRGKITPLEEIKIEELKAAIFPGGLGVTKNLSTFSAEGPKMTVDCETEQLIANLHKKKVPLGFISIAPILAAKIIKCVLVTLGQDNGDKWPNAAAVDATKLIGGRIQPCNVDQICVDPENKVISTPAFMYNGQYHEIFDGIEKLVQGLDELIKTGDDKKDKKC